MKRRRKNRSIDQSEKRKDKHQQIRDWRKTGLYQRMRSQFLTLHPLCTRCLSAGLTLLATELDHIKPVVGDPVKFWDVGNWQGLCRPCHESKTAEENKADDGGWGDRLEGVLDDWKEGGEADDG